MAVTQVEPLEPYRLHLWFDDGSERVVDLSDVLWGPMAEPLRDPEYFRLVRVDAELRTVAWPNGFDLDPDVLHGDHEPAPRRTPLPHERTPDRPAAPSGMDATQVARLSLRWRDHAIEFGAKE